MPKKRPSPSLADSFSAQLRNVIRGRDETTYAVAHAAGVDAAALGRFLSGERGLTTPSVDRLFAQLGLRLVEARRTTRNIPKPVMLVPAEPISRETEPLP